MTKEQLVRAFSRALDEARFLPVPALLRDFASIGEPIAVEAKEELFRIVAAMRGAHGPKLRDIPGRVLYGTVDSPEDCCFYGLGVARPGGRHISSSRVV